MCIALIFNLASSLIISSLSLIILIDPGAVCSVESQAVIVTYSSVRSEVIAWSQVEK